MRVTYQEIKDNLENAMQNGYDMMQLTNLEIIEDMHSCCNLNIEDTSLEDLHDMIETWKREYRT